MNVNTKLLQISTIFLLIISKDEYSLGKYSIDVTALKDMNESAYKEQKGIEREVRSYGW